MTPDEFDAWLRAYGAAWEARDAEGFAALFTDDVRYYWTPFEPPRQERAGVAAAFAAAVARQREIRFAYEVLSVTPERCLARWRCAFTRHPAGHPVRLDGVLLVIPAEGSLCRVFREWWHSDET